MNTTKAVIVGLALLAGTAAYSQNQAKGTDSVSAPSSNPAQALKLEKAGRAYLNCLNSANAGVVESALGHVTFMRIAYPDLDLREIQERVFVLAMEGATKPIRAKAFMALRVFADPAVYKGAIRMEFATGDGLFDQIAGR